MSIATHTPGPWESGEFTGGTPGVFSPSGPICRIPQYQDTPADVVAMNTADAKLIAAAPDLLAACKAAISTFENYDPEAFDKAESLLKEAIAKAEGGAA